MQVSREHNSWRPQRVAYVAFGSITLVGAYYRLRSALEIGVSDTSLPLPAASLAPRVTKFGLTALLVLTNLALSFLIAGVSRFTTNNKLGLFYIANMPS